MCFSKLNLRCLSAAVILPALLGGKVCFTLTARGARICGPNTGDSAGLLTGDDGALIVPASETAVFDVATLSMLETEDTDR